MLFEIIKQTTRATTETLSRSSFWIITGVLILVCYLSGPFGTFDALPNGFRLIYWALIVLSTGGLGLWAHELIHTQGLQKIRDLLLVSLLFGLVASGLVVLISLSLLDPIERFPGLLEILRYSLPSATMVFLLSVVFTSAGSSPETTLETPRAALFRRLEKHPNANSIWSLSAQDHYVEVVTELGTELCLMRLNDAIAEVPANDGIQIHRSHWVAKSAISRLDAKGSTASVHLVDGRELTVSQSRLKALEAFLA